MLKKICINCILLILILIIAEFICFITIKNENKAFLDMVVKTNKNKTYTTQYKILENFNPLISRKSFYDNKSKKKPIIWFGCSFAEGAALDDIHTPCYKISKLTHRSCINRAKGATGTQFIYYQLQQDEFFKEAPEAEYIIYTFIYHHLTRLYQHKINPLWDMFNVRYKILNDKLVEIKPLFKPLYSSFIVKKFLYKKEFKQAQNEMKDFSLFNKLMEEILKITKEKYPNSKFIMLEFENPADRNELPKQEIEKLEAMGITVVRASDIIKNLDDKKYWLDDEIHPSELAWNLIIPEMVKNYIK